MSSSRIQMIRVICVFARVSPGDVHFARGQVDDQCADGLFAVKRIEAFDVVIADRVGDIDMVFLNGL